MGENADEELEVAFDLGRIGYFLEQHKPIYYDQRDDFKEEYCRFKTLASKLGIDLPDLPPEETTAEDEMNRFYSHQVTRVEKDLYHYKSKYIQKIFSIGDRFGKLSITISKCSDAFDENETLWGENVHQLPKLVKQLQVRAESLGVDISEELRQIDDPKQLDEDVANLLEWELKTKLCKRANEPTRNARRSEVDPTRMITDDYWTISLVRLPESVNNKHAFLVLEGIISTKSMIWFADFIANDEFDLTCPGIRDGKVRMSCYESDEVDGSSSKLLFRCDKWLMVIREGDLWQHITWAIHKSTAEELIRNIQVQQSNPPKYNIESSSSTCHNSLTFVRLMLANLNDEHIQIPQDSFDN